MPRGALDNDLLFKGACYLLLAEMIAATPAVVEECGILGAAKYVVANALRTRNLNAALAYFEEHFEKFVLLEPTDQESSVAADIELEAQRRGLQLDGGESLLFAIVELRALAFLGTGDKRAISAMEQIVRGRPTHDWWRGRALCLEQILLRVLSLGDVGKIQEQVCAVAGADKAISICFSCTARSGNVDSWRAGLESYISDLRKVAPTILAPA